MNRATKSVQEMYFVSKTSISTYHVSIAQVSFFHSLSDWIVNRLDSFRDKIFFHSLSNWIVNRRLDSFRDESMTQMLLFVQSIIPTFLSIAIEMTLLLITDY